MFLISVIANALRDILRIFYLHFFSLVYRKKLQGRFEEVKKYKGIGCILVWWGALGVTNLSVSVCHACSIVVELWMFDFFQPH